MSLPKEIAEAMELANKINTKADEILAPLVQEMTIAKWRPEFQEILWNTIAHKATTRARQARTMPPRGEDG